MALNESINRNVVLICLAVVLATGVFLRLPPALFATPGAPLRFLAPLHPNPKWSENGFVGPDEELYRQYTDQTIANGLTGYPDIVRGYIAKQSDAEGAFLPPTRFLLIFAGYIWRSVFSSDTLSSLRDVASLFSIFTLGLTTVVGWRMRGPFVAVALTALVAFAPTQLHMSQNALVDGFFAFWALLALWLLWENLQAADSWRRLIAYSIALACLVLTKESSFFVWIAIVVILVTNRWLRFGRISSRLLIATFLGPLAAVIVLVILSGSISNLINTYELFVTKNYSLPYQIRTGDGPWHRYLVDLLLVSPIVLILAIGAMFRINRLGAAERFFLIFLAATYAMMCNVKYGMNLRFVNMWDVPLRFLALGMLVSLFASVQQRRHLWTATTVALICALELRQYQILFIDHSLHELASEGLLRALNILK